MSNPGIAPAPPSRLQSLTILRFFAAGWVVLHHLQTRAPLPAPELATAFFAGGTKAISLFFILSGIVLAYTYGRLGSAGAVTTFYAARFARIVPCYAFVHLASLWWFTPAMAGWTQWAFVNLLSATGTQAWFPNAFDHGINGGTWTLSVEFFFYSLYPLIALALCSWTPRRYIGRVLVVALIASSARVAAPAIFRGHEGVVYYTLPMLRLPEFVAGVILGLRLAEKPAPATGTAMLVQATLALVAFGFLVAVPAWFLDGTLLVAAEMTTVPVTAWLLFRIARAEQSYQPRWQALPMRALIYLGESSYSLFLVHLLPLTFLDHSYGRAIRDAMVARGQVPALWITVIVVSLAAAALLHETVEKPARRAIVAWHRRRAPG